MPLRRYLPALYLLLIGVVVSISTFGLVYSWEKKDQRAQFESRAKEYSDAVEMTFHNYVGALLFIGDYFNNSSLVTRQEFSGLIESILPRYPGIQTFGWNPLIKNADRSKYESAPRKEGFPDFEFKELSETKNMVRAAHREEYVIVYYLHPLEGNETAFGYDIASNKSRLKAITKGFETGKISATERVTLVQETGNQYGILLLQPIYKQGVSLNTRQERHKNRKGFVVEVLRIGQAIETALGGFAEEGISLTLLDMSAEEGERLLHHRPSKMAKPSEHIVPLEEVQADLVWSNTFNFAERQWKVLLYPTEFYFQSQKPCQSWTILLGSLFLTALLTLYVFKKISYTHEIEQRIKKQLATNELLKEEVVIRIAAERARDQTIIELQQAINEVTKLRGILPICASCKNIRDDEGSWKQIESYIREHSEAEFSHGICPDCARKLYPGLLDDDLKDS